MNEERAAVDAAGPMPKLQPRVDRQVCAVRFLTWEDVAPRRPTFPTKHTQNPMARKIRDDWWVRPSPNLTTHISSDQNLLALPTSPEFGRLAFSYSAALVCNNMPSSIRSVKSLNIFKSHLKTHLFTVCKHALCLGHIATAPPQTQAFMLDHCVHDKC